MEGEISGLKSVASGHSYISTLKDESGRTRRSSA